MALKKILYPLDRTGTAPSNRITAEPHTTGVDRYRAFTLGFAPFFADSVVIREAGKSTPLVRGKDKDYELVYYYQDLSKLCAGKEVAGVVVIRNQNLGTQFEVDYNTIGAHYATSATTIAAAITALELDNRNVYWQNIIDLPDLWQPAPHPHDMGDVFGMEWLLDILASIREALMIGDNAVHTEIINRIDSAITNLSTLWTDHTSKTGNVHGLTPAQLGTLTAVEINNLVQALNKRIDDLGPNFTSIASSLNNLQQQINSLSGAMSSWDQELENLTADYNRLTQQIADTNTTISGISDRIVSVQGDINNLRQRDNNLQDQINALNSSLGGYASAVNALDGRVTSLESRMVAAESNIQDHANQLDQLSARFGNYIPTSKLPTAGTYIGVVNKLATINPSGIMDIAKYTDWHEINSVADYDLRETLQYNSQVGGYQIYSTGYYNAIDVFIRSDIRDKEEITALQPWEADGILRHLKNGIRYVMKGEKVFTAGLSAQTVQRFFSEGVTEVTVQEATDDKEEVKRLSLRQGALIGLLVSGYNFQASEIRELRKLIRGIQKVIADTKSK